MAKRMLDESERLIMQHMDEIQAAEVRGHTWLCGALLHHCRAQGNTCMLRRQ